MTNTKDPIDMLRIMHIINAQQPRKYNAMIDRMGFEPTLLVYILDSINPHYKRHVRLSWRARNELRISIYCDYGRVQNFKEKSAMVQAYAQNKQDEYSRLWIKLPPESGNGMLFGQWTISMIPVGRIDPYVNYGISGTFDFNCREKTNVEVADLISQAAELIVKPNDSTYLSLILETNHTGAWDYNSEQSV